MRKDKTLSGPASVPRPEVLTASRPWLMLASRSALFFLFQLLIALVLFLSGVPSAWLESARWWPFMAIFANIVTIYLLVRLYRAEGKR